MKLRSYQTKIISEVTARWQSGKRRVMVCAPTGSGKTVLFAKIAEKHLVDFPDGRVWVVAHREEILLQAKQKIEAVSQAIIVEEDKVAIVEILDSDQIKIKIGDRFVD